MSESKRLDAAELSLSATGNRKWWQRLLLYPTLVGAIIGAIPTGSITIRRLSTTSSLVL